MKKNSITLLFLLIFISAIFSNSNAQEITQNVQAETLDDETVSNLKKSNVSSDKLKILSSLVGTWYYELKYWSKKDSAPQISSGTMINELIMNGRFLSSKTSAILNIDGQSVPYEGQMIIGYSITKKVFTSVLADTLHAGIVIGVGRYNQKSLIFEETGQFNDMSGDEYKYRSELDLIDNNTHQRTVFIDKNSGKTFKILEIKFYRR